MAYRLDIPGQISEFELRAIEAVASLVPENGCVVEVGALFGLSSWAWAKSVPASASVFCIDPWESNDGVAALAAAHGVRYSLEQFQRYTADCPNVIPIKAYSPDGVGSWERPVDLYFEDAVHENPVLGRNIEVWTSRLTKTGIVCGDDYRPQFPDVRAAAEECARSRGRPLWIVDFFWCVLPDPADVPAVAEVERTLAGLEREASLARIQAPKISIIPLVPLPTQITAGQTAMLTLRIVNDGRSAWTGSGGDPLAVTVRYRDLSGAIAGEFRHPLGTDSLAYDEPIHFVVPLPVDAAARDRLDVVVSLPGAGATPISALDASFDVAQPQPPGFADILSLAVGGTDRVRWLSDHHPAEAAYTWTRGTESDLQIDIDPMIADPWLTLRVQPFVAGSRTTQRLRIEIGGVAVFAGTLWSAAIVSIPLPRPYAAPLTIRLHHPDAARPCEHVPGNGDGRPLAFGIESIAVSTGPLIV